MPPSIQRQQVELEQAQPPTTPRGRPPAREPNRDDGRDERRARLLVHVHSAKAYLIDGDPRITSPRHRRGESEAIGRRTRATLGLQHAVSIEPRPQTVGSDRSVPEPPA